MGPDHGRGIAVQAVEHLLQIDVDGMQHSHGPLVLLKTDTMLPSLELGQRFDLETWPEHRFGPTVEQDQALFVVRIETRFHHTGSTLLCHRTLTLAASPDPQYLELLDAQAETESQSRRAEFAELLARSMAADLCAGLLDRCAAGIESELRSTPARGLTANDQTAWLEAAEVVQAAGHLLREEVDSEVASLADAAVRRLSLAQRQALWLHYEDSPESTDLKYVTDEWATRDLSDFDPAKAWPGALEEVESAIVRRVLTALANERLARHE